MLFLSLTHTFSSLVIMTVPCYNSTASGMLFFLSFLAGAAKKKSSDEEEEVERHEMRTGDPLTTTAATVS